MYVRITLFALLLMAVYYVGVLHCNQKNISQKLEETRYVKTKEIEILSTPNADKSALLNLMQHNKL